METQGLFLLGSRWTTGVCFVFLALSHRAAQVLKHEHQALLAHCVNSSPL